MKKISDVSKEIENYLTVCLARSIDYALTNNSNNSSGCKGSQWFKEFANQDQKSQKPIIAKDHTNSIYDLDFQGVLKILFFRLPIRMDVLSYYYPDDNSSVIYGNKTAFHELIQRLISRYRNDIAAHQNAGNIEASLYGQQKDSVYGYTEAIQDMLKLGKIFSFTVDDTGTSYYSIMENIYADYQQKSAFQIYSIYSTIQSENLNIDQGQFCIICNSIGVEILTSNNEMCFKTNDYRGTIDRIKDKIIINEYNHSTPAPKKNSEVNHIIPVVCIIIAVVALGLLMINKNNKDSNGRTFVGNTDNNNVNIDSSSTSNEDNLMDNSGSTTSNNHKEEIADTATTVDNSKVISGSTTFQGLTFSVDQAFDGSYIELCYSNGQNSFALGWASQAQVTAVTDKGTYSTSIQNNTFKIAPSANGSIPLYFDNLEGDIKKITINSVNVLNSRGLPSNSPGDTVTVDITYGATNDANSTTESTSLSNNVSITGSASFQGLTFSVDQAFDGSYIELCYSNGQNSFALGWASQAQVTAVTDKGTYSTSIQNNTFKIAPSASGSIPLYFDNLEGDIKKITISSVNVLNSSGLPSNSPGDTVTVDITYNN